jgi:rare lipoprotein A
MATHRQWRNIRQGRRFPPPTRCPAEHARVTNLRNDRSIVVRVNDRWTYHGGRVMDVSARGSCGDFQRRHDASKWNGSDAPILRDDDDKLLATLRDDGQAQIDAPVMTAANEIQRVRRYDERADAAELSARIAYENGQASEDQMRAYARQESDAPLPPSREQANIDNEPVASTQKVRKVVAPLPPVRPAQFGARQASARSAIRQALNSSVRTN